VSPEQSLSPWFDWILIFILLTWELAVLPNTEVKDRLSVESVPLETRSWSHTDVFKDDSCVFHPLLPRPQSYDNSKGSTIKRLGFMEVESGLTHDISLQPTYKNAHRSYQIDYSTYRVGD
jgi:hypothetical protein